MKTADLIPLILLELNEHDKYGFEITKAIETKSMGKIVIKQPTLYTVLKKLEKSKFISSYWEDSEIGGKRHYYKLTQNGKLQVSTLPSYSILLNTALQDEDVDFSITEDSISGVNEGQNTQHIDKEPKKLSIMDELLKVNSPAPTESVLPTNEVFNENNIDNSTEFGVNVSNTDILKDDTISANESFAENLSVSKFTDVIAPTSNEIKKEISLKTELTDVLNSNKNDESRKINLDLDMPKTTATEDEIKFVDYINFKNTKEYKQSKAIAKKLMFQSVLTGLILLAVSLLCYFITHFTGRSPLFYFFFISALVIALFYPVITGCNLQKIRLKYQKEDYKPNTKLKLYISMSAVLAVVVSCFIINLSSDINTFITIFRWKNFANLYAPILISCSMFVDVLFNFILFKNALKTKN